MCATNRRLAHCHDGTEAAGLQRHAALKRRISSPAFAGTGATMTVTAYSNYAHVGHHERATANVRSRNTCRSMIGCRTRSSRIMKAMKERMHTPAVNANPRGSNHPPPDPCRARVVRLPRAVAMGANVYVIDSAAALSPRSTQYGIPPGTHDICIKRSLRSGISLIR